MATRKKPTKRPARKRAPAKKRAPRAKPPKAAKKRTTTASLRRNKAGAELSLRRAGTALKGSMAAMRLGRCELANESIVYASRAIGGAEAHASAANHEKLGAQVLKAQAGLQHVREEFGRVCVIGSQG